MLHDYPKIRFYLLRLPLFEVLEENFDWDLLSIIPVSNWAYSYQYLTADLHLQDPSH
jgi:hypothetical protein